jgi:RNA-directed DNA polymerase
MSNPQLVSMLARAFLAGEPSVEAIAARGSRLLGRNWRWLRPLAKRYIEAFAGQIRPRHRNVMQFLQRDPGFAAARSKYFHELSIHEWLTGPQPMQPIAAAAGWDIPPILSTADLADWLSATPEELEWFADLKGLSAKGSPAKTQHYHYRILAKLSGSIRLIEAPKPRLKEMQRQILTGILEKIPPHPKTHGFVKGRSIQTFAAPHVGRRVVLRMDLRDFFPSISGARVQALFRTAGYPEPVADLLGGLCTNVAPRSIWKEHIAPALQREMKALYARPHLPQGAPTSPALANLSFWRADCRLSGLAQSMGARYTRYADDLAFSGSEELDCCVERFSLQAAAILLEEGFAAHHRKTRIMRQSVRHHLAGLVTNQRINLARDDFDQLKAILTNCIRHGPESQNRESHPRFRDHLEGRVRFAESIHATKGARLRALLEQIKWT